MELPRENIFAKKVHHKCLIGFGNVLLSQCSISITPAYVSIPLTFSGGIEIEH